MKKNLFLLATLLISASAWAQQGPSAWTEDHFSRLDANQDGQVSRAEYRQFMEEAYANLDKDGNGRVTPAEAAGVLTIEQFARVDTNQDGTIGKTEFMDAVMADFDRQDRDGDGFLSRE
ncbi:EF-hand domain-containing protein [Castellaniella sp.]|uniref:EF-hand domain-containing protein n=1 Tax=Castellaniella sp. TaxID=1955812 RepID=UPI003566BE14